MIQFSSVREVLGLPLCFSESSFSAVRSSLTLFLHTDTSSQLKTFWPQTLTDLRWIPLWLTPSAYKNLIPRGPHTRNNCHSHRPFCSLGWRGNFPSTWRTNICNWHRDVTRSTTTTTKTKTLWLQLASELYQPCDRRLSAKLVPTLRIECVTWSEWRIPAAVISVF
jgi:hypothetical protein